MRPLFEPRLVNGVLGDPGLYVDFRDERRALLFDLGELSRQPPRKLLRLSDVFISHTHVDHFIGFDHLLRVILGRKARLALTGGPGFVGQVEHRLAAYTWNVVHRYDVELVLDVTEVDPSGAGRRARFSSRRRFACEPGDPFAIAGDVIHAEMGFRVRARCVDHQIPCLAYALEESAHVNVWKNRLAELGLGTGPWLRELKQAALTGAADDAPILACWRDRDGEHRETRPFGELRGALEIVPGQRIGYATDLRFTERNVAALTALLAGVDVLFIESVFLDADGAHAERKNHLTARQAGSIARAVGARVVVPFHFSPRYEGREAEVQAEVMAAWAGKTPGAGG